ncbi:hypothetical protein GCM10023317_64430 [Actinopolymorpha pittospori]
MSSSQNHTVSVAAGDASFAIAWCKAPTNWPVARTPPVATAAEPAANAKAVDEWAGADAHSTLP